MAGSDKDHLKVMFIAGGLGKGGAEKQFLYMLQALQSMNVQMKVLSLSQGEYHEQSLEKINISLKMLGALKPPLRLAQIIKTARAFQPHFIQATHFFASLYAGLTGRLTGIPSIGAIRGDLHHDQAGIGKGSNWLLRLPDSFIANSFNARENFLRYGLPPARVHVLQNVIDIRDFDHSFASPPLTLMNPDRRRVITVARLMPVKRLERFLYGLALARQRAPEIEGVIVGSGPEENHLKDLAKNLGLLGNAGFGVQFLGERSDIPQLLAQSILFVLTSDREGFPNVLLEAMAASLPVLTTPAGECRTLVENGVNGYLVPFDDPQALADRMIELVRSPARRRIMGNAGRRLVENQFSHERLAAKLVSIYHAIAQQTRSQSTLRILSANGTRQQATKEMFTYPETHSRTTGKTS